MPVGQLDPKHCVRQQLDDRAFYFNASFARHVRISGLILVIKTVCSKCAEGIPSAVRTVQPSSSSLTSESAHVNHRFEWPASCPVLSAGRFRACRNSEFAVLRAFFVQRRADKFAHNRKIGAARFVFDFRADIGRGVRSS